MKQVLLIILFLMSVISSCSIEPKPIIFGSDQCNYCKMNIVDKLHAAQFVTKKGKQFKFDAIECMVNQVEDIDESSIAKLMVSNYGDFGVMIDAKLARYLISPQIKSPMGANLSAFDKSNNLDQIIKQYSGDLYDWDQLKKQLRKK